MNHALKVLQDAKVDILREMTLVTTNRDKCAADATRLSNHLTKVSVQLREVQEQIDKLTNEVQPESVDYEPADDIRCRANIIREGQTFRCLGRADHVKQSHPAERPHWFAKPKLGDPT